MSDTAFATPVRVVIVDDSALVRQLLRTILDGDPRIQVVATASDPLQARAAIKETDPDVVTLDIEMPHMDGLSFLEKIMTLRPMPVVMISSLTSRGAETTLTALEMGAVDFVQKPAVDLSVGLADLAREITDKVVAAAGVKRRLSARCAALRPSAGPAATGGPAPVPLNSCAERAVVAIGASTGGVEALREVVSALPPGMPAVLMAVHMPAAYTGRFAARLDALSPLAVKEAEHGESVLPGHVYIAPGGQHLELAGAEGAYRCRLHRQDKVQGHRPSVDVLFGSVAAAAGSRAVGVILTGMGRDGADGLKRMRDAGARTVGQDERSCIVYGMPRAARELGAVEREVPLPRIASTLVGLLAGLGRIGEHPPSGL
ncbi:protein-glutamate methylesterase/protein-glutamine glutaminase [Azospirillum picis]|uniref:Protein-glutamate methylesterase/protein-glutamine glutaminase n=1 Tax=Azospirillum picis TaxID=488438 RepID=A0ABU0MVA5_9PROT|nr:chemotaxis response regulator protein-glutamate methylesterase [Azospirillum picis]MBP2303509.1 two-component system chemotaxis response regulator CheB [Azospirillum picis]MDQ0537412.1 two-component system chemotaxis response regulator CheB [Azospirillum picis]